MDVEKRFISSLLRAKPSEQEQFFSAEYPIGVFTNRGDEMQWIRDFWRRHHKAPSVKLYCSRFGTDLPRVSDPMTECFQPIADLYLFQQMKKVQETAQQRLKESVPLPEVFAMFRQEVQKMIPMSSEMQDVPVETSRGALTRYVDLVRFRSKNVIIDSPWESMNTLAKFFRPKETMIVAARTSMGKTWIVLWLAHYFANRGHRVLFISKEMPTETIEDRLECLRYKLPYTSFREGSLPPKLLRKWKREKAKKVSYPLTLSGDETLEGTSLQEVYAKIQQHSPQIAIVDGAYMLRPEGSNRMGPVERLTMISQGLKRIAKYSSTLIIAVVQMNRTAENKSGTTKGSVVSVYGADAWAQDTDWLIDVSGQRGAASRTIQLLKGRESGLGDFNINFAVDPYPFFGELSGNAPAVSSALKSHGDGVFTGPLFPPKGSK